jgi:hypothetical protein
MGITLDKNLTAFIVRLCEVKADISNNKGGVNPMGVCLG